jgi:hypothetical protein
MKKQTLRLLSLFILIMLSTQVIWAQEKTTIEKKKPEKAVIDRFDFSSDEPLAQEDFSFWIGDWEVYKTGTDAVVGKSKIEIILNGQAIQESYYSTGSSYSGTSLNKYVKDANRWEQYWVDNTGLRLYLIGNFSDGKMVLSDCETRKAGPCNRISWWQKGKGIRQVWEQSEDNGATWTIVFDGTYKSRK